MDGRKYLAQPVGQQFRPDSGFRHGPYSELKVPHSESQDQGDQANAHRQTHNAEQGSPKGLVFGVEEVNQEIAQASVVSFAI